jgi:ribulose-5-phosphate 4-epimerase/fuculose-1-phosphate aldolase
MTHAGTRSSAPRQANIPKVQRAEDPEVERAHRKWQVAVGYRILARFGLDEGIAGHITARDPVDHSTFWTAPFGRYFGRITPEELLCVDDSGAVIRGEGLLNRAAFAIHSAVHAARQDVVGAVHAHGLHAKAYSTLVRPLRPITQDACAFYDDHAVHETYAGVVFDQDEGRRIARSLDGNKAVVLANHGHLTVGTTVGSAVWWFVTMERSFQAQLLADAAGEPRPLDHDVALETWRSVGTEDVGAFAFAVLAERIVSEQPDLRR